MLVEVDRLRLGQAKPRLPDCKASFGSTGPSPWPLTKSGAFRVARSSASRLCRNCFVESRKIPRILSTKFATTFPTKVELVEPLLSHDTTNNLVTGLAPLPRAHLRVVGSVAQAASLLFRRLPVGGGGPWCHGRPDSRRHLATPQLRRLGSLDLEFGPCAYPFCRKLLSQALVDGPAPQQEASRQEFSTRDCDQKETAKCPNSSRRLGACTLGERLAIPSGTARRCAPSRHSRIPP